MDHFRVPKTLSFKTRTSIGSKRQRTTDNQQHSRGKVKTVRSKSELRAGKHEAVVLSVGLCKFTNLHGNLYLQYSVTQKKLYIKSKTPCPIRFLTTGQYLFVVVHVFFCIRGEHKIAKGLLLKRFSTYKAFS